MPNDETQQRLDSEFVAVNAIRELIRLVSRGNSSQATYEKALRLGDQICPEILGKGVSLLRRHRYSSIAREYVQRAEAVTRQRGHNVSPIELLKADLHGENELLTAAKGHQRTDQLKARVSQLQRALEELDESHHSEHQVLWRDSNNLLGDVPAFHSGRGYKDYVLPDNNVVRLRTFHPDKAESISGADVIYERHVVRKRTVRIVGVQYKIWQDKKLYLNDARMQSQLSKMQHFFCKRRLCVSGDGQEPYRFPFCSAFLRPTDQLQSEAQDLRSSGEHIPICQIERVATTTPKGARVLCYDDITTTSLSYNLFDELFTSGKIGSRELSYEELGTFYESLGDLIDSEKLVIHAQDFDEDSEWID